MATTVIKSIFGKYPDGRDVELYTLTNANGMEAQIINLGAIIVKLIVPDAAGNKADVVLGFDTVEEYMANPCFFGAVIGPNANRIGNAEFAIDGVTYKVDVNDGPNNLHSHIKQGYHKLLWDAEIVEGGVKLSLADTDGNLGFPGNKKVSVTYTLDDENKIALHYHGCSDKKTVLNMTNHTYFNLDGHDSGSIVNHSLKLACSNYTPGDAGSIPTGEIAPVAGTPMDFTASKVIANEIDADFEQNRFGGGYDHNWVIDGWKNDGALICFAEVKAAKSGRVMKVYTDLPGVQFYAGNFITPQGGKDGVQYNRRGGLCLETQYFPDSINKPQFPACVFGEDKEYDTVTVYQFC